MSLVFPAFMENTEKTTDNLHRQPRSDLGARAAASIMYLFVWHVLACMVCISTYGTYLYVMIRIGWYMYVLPVLPVLYVLACMVCMAGICTYCAYYTYWYVFKCIGWYLSVLHVLFI